MNPSLQHDAESGRRTLITGAGQGIGRAIASSLAAPGARLALYGRRADTLEETAARCRAQGAEALAFPGDVTDERRLVAVAALLAAEWGALDGLVNNAGIASFGTIETTTPETWRQVLEVNLTGPYLVSRAVLPLLRRGEDPAIVHVASNLGLVALKNAAAYCAAKAGLVNLTRAMALDHAGEGIRVNAVCPGAVATPMLLTDRGDGAEAPAVVAELARAHPLGRIAEPEEVAAAVAFLLSPACRFATGTILAVDGGSTAGFAR
ncbi:MAG: SDR family oxidoreductase [Acidobacteria bacterium]|nr:SDR family oxidoreductase [Acidobacteriota bacterium]